MSKPKVQAILNRTTQYISENASGILTGVGIAGMATSVILAAKSAPLAKYKVCEKEEREHRELKFKDKFKLLWKDYLPTAITFGLSTFCLVESVSTGNRRNAALAAAYGLSQQALDDLRNGVINEVGEKKYEEIRTKTAIKRAEMDQPVEDQVVVVPGGSHLMREDYSGIYFRSSFTNVQTAMEKLNLKIKEEGCASLLDFYNLLGIPKTGVSGQVGWNIDDIGDGDESNKIKVVDDYFKSETGEPCCVFHYSVDPHIKFNYFG